VATARARYLGPSKNLFDLRRAAIQNLEAQQRAELLAALRHAIAMVSTRLSL
jgi:hypothetical protein